MIRLSRTESNNIMMDIETLGTAFNSAVFQVAMVRFDFNGNIYNHFVANIDYKDQLKHGLITESGTIDWWKSQNKSILKEILDNPSPTEEVLDAINNYVKPDDIIWSSGNFDVPIMQSLYKAYGKELPWKYWNALDIRVLTRLANINIRTDYDYMQQKTHNALDDCKFQILYCKDAVDIISK